MKLHNMVLGLMVVALGAATLMLSQNFPDMAYFRYGPGFFPGVIGALLLLFGVILTIQGVIERQGDGLVTLGAWTRDPKLLVNFALIIAAVVFFILTVDRLGFHLTGFIVLFGTIWRLWGQPAKSLLIAAVATIVTQQAFGELPLVPLPWGLLETWAGTLTWR